jgi:hypothetical protein
MKISGSRFQVSSFKPWQQELMWLSRARASRWFDFMRLRNSGLIRAVVFGICALVIPVEAQTTAQERANRLREQMVEVLAQQESLEVRLLQLEEALKPENIEKSLAGIGSTRPEELRELRRRQLDLERTSIQNQLKQLADSRTRLDAAIIEADAAAYHQSAANKPRLRRVRRPER